MTSVFIREKRGDTETEKHTQREESPVTEEAETVRMYLKAKELQGFLQTTRLTEAWVLFLLPACRRKQPCRHFDFRLWAFRTVGEYFSVAEAVQIMALCYHSPKSQIHSSPVVANFSLLSVQHPGPKETSSFPPKGREFCFHSVPEPWIYVWALWTRGLLLFPWQLKSLLSEKDLGKQQGFVPVPSCHFWALQPLSCHSCFS